MKSKFFLFTLLAGILWGSISIFLHQLADAGLSQFVIMFFRSIISAVILGLFILFKSPSSFKIKLKDIWIFLGSGVLSLTFFTFCYFKTINESGASVAVVLLYTSPVFVMLFSAVLFKEKITFIKIIALILTISGCVLVTGLATERALSISGILIGLCSGLGYGLYSIFGRFALRKYSQPTLLFYTFLFSAVTSIPFCNFECVSSGINLFTSLNLLGISVICTVLPYAFYTYGLSGLETGKAAILVTVEPVVGCLTGIFLWKEDASILKILGIIIMLSSILILNIKSKNLNAE